MHAFDHLIKHFKALFKKKRLEPCDQKTTKPYPKRWKLITEQVKDNFTQYQGNSIGPVKQTFLLKERQVSPSVLDKLTRLKNRLSKPNITDQEAKNVIKDMVDMRMFEEIIHVLNKKKSADDWMMYAALLVIDTRDYLNAVRILKEIRKPAVFEPVINKMIADGCIEEVTDIIERIRYYGLYYHRLTQVEANIYQHHAYAYAAIAACRHKYYDQADLFGQKVGRCIYAWVDMVKIITDNKDFFMVERFADQAGHLKTSAYTIAYKQCPDTSPWKVVFEQKLSDKALITV